LWKKGFSVYDASMKLGFSTTDRIVALSTCRGRSALALIRTSGAGSIGAINAFLDKPIPVSAVRKACRRFLINPQNGKTVDDALITVFAAPSSYTGEEMAEIACHGSMAIVDSVLEMLIKGGFRQAEKGEFTFRAFVNGKMDLTQAEAVEEIISARTASAASMALDRLHGSIRRTIMDFRASLLLFAAGVELRLDYGEDDIPDEPMDFDVLVFLEKKIRQLIDTYSIGRLYQEGAKVVLCGATNAGKSSLFNRILKEERSIVSDIHGTTRDYVHDTVSLEGFPIILFDTAGLRTSLDPIENEGIRRTRQVIEEADLVLYLVDSTQGESQKDKEFLAALPDPSRIIRIWAKADSGRTAPEDYLAVSAVGEPGLALMEKAIVRKLGVQNGMTFGPVLDSARQKDLLLECAQSLRHVLDNASYVPLDALAVDLKDALDALGKITGEITTEEILDTLFGNFCVGK
jgi:tRNA modification GTPase